MKIVQINVTCGLGSTGKIVLQVSQMLNLENIENYVLYSSGQSSYDKSIKHANCIDIKIQALRSRVFGNYGFNSVKTTKNLISKLKDINPDIVHLHNMHGHNCNLEMLFGYLKNAKIKVFWTFHDCWVFTGYCPHFDMYGCDKWKTECNKCPQKKYYSWFFDKSKRNYNRKKAALTGLDLTIITPSEWLAGLVKQSFLKDYPVKVINNGIDLSIFKPTQSDFRKKYNCENKFIVLGVAFGWGKRKGLDVFVELSKRLDEHFQIVLVGTDDNVDKILPNNIISIHRTNNQIELAEIYSAADVFVNPTREENYPTVNMESIACGTPVITFNTGGSPEILNDECGIVVNKEDVVRIERIILEMLKNPISQEKCLEHAKSFDQQERIKEYIELFKGE